MASILEGTTPLPRRDVAHTQSLELHPESVQRYRRRDRILFYYTGELVLRSYYTYTYTMYICYTRLYICI